MNDQLELGDDVEFLKSYAGASPGDLGYVSEINNGGQYCTVKYYSCEPRCKYRDVIAFADIEHVLRRLVVVPETSVEKSADDILAQFPIGSRASGEWPRGTRRTGIVDAHDPDGVNMRIRIRLLGERCSFWVYDDTLRAEPEPTPAAQSVPVSETPALRELTRAEDLAFCAFYAGADDKIVPDGSGKTAAYGWQAALSYAATRGYTPDPEPRCGHACDVGSTLPACERATGHAPPHASTHGAHGTRVRVWTDDGSLPYPDLAREGGAQ